MKRSTWLSLSIFFALGCSDPAADAPDAAAAPDVGIDAAVIVMEDAAMEDAPIVDAFVGPDAVDYDGGPPATWDEVYALFDVTTCGSGRTGCHYTGTSGGLSLATSATACAQLHLPGRSSTCSIPERVVAGDPSNSLLYRKLEGAVFGCGARMPDGRTPFTPDQLSVVGRWILAGATCP